MWGLHESHWSCTLLEMGTDPFLDSVRSPPSQEFYVGFSARTLVLHRRASRTRIYALHDMWLVKPRGDDRLQTGVSEA